MKRLACPAVASRLLPASNRLGGALCALTLLATLSTGSAAQTSLTKHTASDASASAWFGDNVAIDGDLAVVGAPCAESAYIYRRMGGVWVEEKILTAWEGGSAQFFGISSSISTAGDPLSAAGDVVAVGAAFHKSAGGELIGGVFTWRHDGSEWVQEQIIEASDAKHVDFFGVRIALDLDLLVVGAPADERSGDTNLNTGTFYVFEFNGSSWDEKIELDGSGAVRADQFGGAVAVCGTPGNERIVIGAYNEDLVPGQLLDNEGVTYVFERVSNVWTEVARIVAPDADPQDIAGWAVAVSGDVVATSAILDDETNPDAGAVYVYRAPDWVTPVKVMAPGGAAGDRFGELIALDGDMLLVGAPRAFGGDGAAYSYRWDGLGWPHEETILSPDADAAGDGFGVVGLQGGTAVIGAWKDSEKGVGAGAVYFGLLGNTPQGMVVVNPSDSTTGTSTVTLEYSTVTGEGQTTVTSSTTGPPPPSGFQVGNQDLYYEISTTATFNGAITVCIQYDENDFGNEDNIVLHHFVGGMWVVPLVQTLDTGVNVVCADVTSLSPFAVLESVDLDSDDDGLLDSTELEMAQGSGCPDPFNADSDGDTLLDGQEVLQGTNPCLADTDGDGVSDAEDPLPTEPGVTSGWLEDAARTLATDIQNLDLTLFSGPNPNANSGRRGVLTNHATGAANAIAAGQTQSAIALLHSLLNRIDGSTAQDWMGAGAETTALRATVELLLDLLAL